MNNLDDLFNKAKNQKPLISDNDITNFVKNNLSSFDKKKTLFNTKNIIISILAIIAITTLFLLIPQENNNTKLLTKQITENYFSIDTTNNHIEPEKITPDNTNIAQNNFNTKPTKYKINNDKNILHNLTSPKNDINQIPKDISIDKITKTVQLTKEDMSRLGISLDENGNYIEIFINSEKPFKHRIYVDKGIEIFENILNDDSTIFHIPLPAFITDNLGWKNIDVCNSLEEKKLYKFDNKIDSLISTSGYINEDGNLILEYNHNKFSKNVNKNELIKNKIDYYNQHNINKLIPIAVPIENAKDEYGNKLDDFKLILWYELNDNLISLLPNQLTSKINCELNLLQQDSDICSNIPNVGDDHVLGIWQGCSGSVQNMRVFPNPTNGPITIDFILKDNRRLSIALYDLAGNKIKDLSNDINVQKGKWTDKYDIADLQKGIYLIIIKTDQNEQAIQRILVDK